ncbi:FliC/FljB family flagellin [Escherichia coli]
MAQVINTNSLSLITQNNINKNQSALSSSIERLSSGLRINSAKDDAAGQAIANRFTSNIKGLTQAARNANDGISVAQTTEGALSEINNNLQRIRELTVQATTGTNSTSDLDSIQDEIKSRLDEIDRVSGQTQFNGVNVLSKDGSMKIQVGANDGETITIDLKKIDSDTLNLAGFNVNGKGSVANTAATTDNLTLAGFTAGTKAADGTVTYSKNVQFAAATASNVLAAAKDGDEITFAGNNGTGIAATGGTYTYHKDSNSYSFSATAASKDSLLSTLAPNAGDTFTAKVTIGSKSQEVNVSKDGTITSSDGKALYLDEKGNLTQTGSGTTKAATWDNLMANTDTTGKDAYGNSAAAAVGTVIEAKGMTITSAGGNAQVLKDAAYNAAYATSITTGTPGDAGAAATAGNAAVGALGATAVDNTTADVADISISASQMASILQDKDFTLSDGSDTYNVTSNAVTINGKAANIDDSGAITDQTSKVVNYFAHTNGSVTNDTGSTIYATEDGSLTTDAATKAETTADPLKALDEAISSIDKFRSSLGAVQNRLDSAVTNLNNTTTNLSEAQSRIRYRSRFCLCCRVNRRNLIN